MPENLTVFFDDGRKPNFEHGLTDDAAKARVIELFDAGQFSSAFDGETVVYMSNPMGVFTGAGEVVDRA